MEKNNEFKLRKIPLEPLFHLLMDLMKDGANYIDLEGYIDPEQMQDILKISAPDEYYDDYKEQTKELPPHSEDTHKLSADDINELL